MMPKLLYIDLFCGAGGVTTGVVSSGAAKVVACVNHDPNAIRSHAINHPDVLHYTEDIRTLDTAPMLALLDAMRRKYPEAKSVLWASCECTNFSRAKGGKPRDPDSRSLAEHLYRYMEALDPDFIQIENVEEFLDWGPLVMGNGGPTPDKSRKGIYFKRWFDHIEGMGYAGEWRVLNAADFGAYTSRRRLFVQFAKAGEAVVWPEPVLNRDSWRACRDVLDLGDWGESIFTRKRPLCDATLRRLAEGIRKFAEPQFVFRYMSGPGHVHSGESPCPTVCTQKNLYLASVGKFMDNYYGRGYASSIDRPCGSLCTKAQKFPVTCVFTPEAGDRVRTGAFIRAMMRPRAKGLVYSVEQPMKTLLTRDYFYVNTCVFLPQYHHGGGQLARIDRPHPAVLTNNHSQMATCRFGRRRHECLPPVYNQPAVGDSEVMLSLKAVMRERGIADVFMRPISVRESLRVMGFPEGYQLVGTQTEQRKYVGNAVEVTMARYMAQALAESLGFVPAVSSEQMRLNFGRAAS